MKQNLITSYFNTINNTNTTNITNTTNSTNTTNTTNTTNIISNDLIIYTDGACSNNGKKC